MGFLEATMESLAICARQAWRLSVRAADPSNRIHIEPAGPNDHCPGHARRRRRNARRFPHLRRPGAGGSWRSPGLRFHGPPWSPQSPRPLRRSCWQPTILHVVPDYRGGRTCAPRNPRPAWNRGRPKSPARAATSSFSSASPNTLTSRVMRGIRPAAQAAPGCTTSKEHRAIASAGKHARPRLIRRNPAPARNSLVILMPCYPSSK